MNFDELHELVPYARFGKEKSLTMEPYPGITLAMPGRHAEDCSPRGGDFVVMVTDKDVKWKRHQFTHDDIFRHIEKMTVSSAMNNYTDFYLDVIAYNADPLDCPFGSAGLGSTIDPKTFYCAVQCLAVAEHRRYSQHEEKFGGRYLPFRFAAGIYEGLWTADDAIEKQKYGRPAVERLEKKKGVPALTQKLMGTTP
jgi:hypothetical protein